jgi:NAD(P)-dependent dehydrogenase (short-subunit alcohol dehydrogenase family)
MRLRGKVALVTGSSQGIGKSIVRKLLESGAIVILTARRTEKLMQTQQQLMSLGAEVHAIPADVSNWKDCQRLIEEVIARFGRLDILINNAGAVARGSIEDMAPEVFRKVFDVNVLGTIYPTKAALSFLRSSNGSVVSVSSIASFHGIPYNSVYSASKKALTAI